MRLFFLYLISFLSTKFLGLDRSLLFFRKVGLLLNQLSHPRYSIDELSSELSRSLHRIPFAVKCLDQAVVAWYCLNRNSHAATLKIGISITPIESHAWVECEKQILVNTYNLADLSVVAEYGPWDQNLTSNPATK